MTELSRQLHVGKIIDYVGQTMQDAQGRFAINYTGLLAAAHRGGALGLKRYLHLLAANGWNPANVTSSDTNVQQTYNDMAERLRYFSDRPYFENLPAAP